MRTDSKTLYDFLSDDQISILERHLQSRFANNYRNEKFNVVFDLLHQCDINCVGCGTNAICIKGIQKIENPELTFEDIEKILLKIRCYADKTNKEVFINFGGGEPFLRNDIIQILKRAYELFGANGVGIDTNASLIDSYELISQATPYVWEKIWSESPAKTIEHIHPQTYKDTWKGKIGTNQEEIETTVHTIGNLVLLPPGINSIAGQKPFSEKKEIYKKYHLFMLEKIRENEDWGKIEIENRELELIDFIKIKWGTV